MNAQDKIDHVAINVSDLEASVNWYLSSFDCCLLHKTPTSAELQFSNMSLILILPSQQPPHLAILREDAHLFGALREQSDHKQTTMISDPSGNVIELVAR